MGGRRRRTYRLGRIEVNGRVTQGFLPIEAADVGNAVKTNPHGDLGGWVGGWVKWVEENEAVGMRCCGLYGRVGGLTCSWAAGRFTWVIISVTGCSTVLFCWGK